MEQWVPGFWKRTRSSPTKLHCCRSREERGMRSPNSLIGRHRAPVQLTERIHPDTNSSVARWHNITAVFFFHQVTFNLCPDISRQSCLISPIRAGHLPTPFPEVIVFGSIAGWAPASHNLPCESPSSLSLGTSPALRLMIASKKLSNLPSWIFCPSSHALPPSSWPGRLKTPRGCPLWAADEAMLPLSFSMFLCVLGGRGQAQSCLLLLVATYPWLCFFPICHCCYH